MALKRHSQPSVSAETAAIPPELVVAGDAGAAKKNAKKEPSKTVRVTLDLPRELNFRLESIAAFKRKKKGAFAVELIDQRLKDFKADISLKNVWAEIHSQSSEAA